MTYTYNPLITYADTESFKPIAKEKLSAIISGRYNKVNGNSPSNSQYLIPFNSQVHLIVNTPVHLIANSPVHCTVDTTFNTIANIPVHPLATTIVYTIANMLVHLIAKTQSIHWPIPSTSNS